MNTETLYRRSDGKHARLEAKSITSCATPSLLRTLFLWPTPDFQPPLPLHPAQSARPGVLELNILDAKVAFAKVRPEARDRAPLGGARLDDYLVSTEVADGGVVYVFAHVCARGLLAGVA